MSKYTAIIIEPRKHKALLYVLNNFLNNLSNEWSIIIFHGNNNIEYINECLLQIEENLRSRIIKLVNLNVDNLNATTYSNLFMSESFYENIPTETFLVFQTDSIILKENKDTINIFLDYDYVGAPWIINNRVGNGGLSLRKKSKMLEIVKNKGYKELNEDYYFSFDIDEKISYNVPSCDQAKSFCVETMFHEAPFGIHNCWKAMWDRNALDILINKYSEIKELIDLQVE
jgi:hypothetical protein